MLKDKRMPNVNYHNFVAETNLILDLLRVTQGLLDNILPSSVALQHSQYLTEIYRTTVVLVKEVSYLLQFNLIHCQPYQTHK